MLISVPWTFHGLVWLSSATIRHPSALGRPLYHRLSSDRTLLSLSFLCVCKSSRLKLANCSHSTNQTVITGIMLAFPSNGWAANSSCGLNSWKTASCGKTGGLCSSVHDPMRVCVCVSVCYYLYIRFMPLFGKCALSFIKLNEQENLRTQSGKRRVDVLFRWNLIPNFSIP